MYTGASTQPFFISCTNYTFPASVSSTTAFFAAPFFDVEPSRSSRLLLPPVAAELEAKILSEPTAACRLPRVGANTSSGGLSKTLVVVVSGALVEPPAAGLDGLDETGVANRSSSESDFSLGFGLTFMDPKRSSSMATATFFEGEVLNIPVSFCISSRLIRFGLLVVGRASGLPSRVDGDRESVLTASESELWEAAAFSRSFCLEGGLLLPGRRARF